MLHYHRRLAAGAGSATALAGAIASTGDPVPLVCFGAAWSAPGHGQPSDLEPAGAVAYRRA